MKLPVEQKYEVYGEIDDQNNVNEKIIKIETRQVDYNYLDYTIKNDMEKLKNNADYKIPVIIEQYRFFEILSAIQKDKYYVLINNKYLCNVNELDSENIEGFLDGFNKFYYKFGGNIDKYIEYYTKFPIKSKPIFEKITIKDLYEFAYNAMKTDLPNIKAHLKEYVESFGLISKLAFINKISAENIENKDPDASVVLKSLIKMFGDIRNDYYYNLFMGVFEKYNIAMSLKGAIPLASSLNNP